MQVTVIRDTTDLALLEEEWNELLECSAADTLFLTWEWISSWIVVQQPQVDLFVVVVRDENRRLLALAPFYKTPYRLFGCVNITILRVLGDLSSGGEYGSVIVRQSYEQEATAQIAQCLGRKRREWDIIYIPNIARWDPGYPILESVFRERPLRNRVRDRIFGAFTLPSDPDEYLATMSKNRRQQLRRTCRKVFRNPNFKVVQVNDPEMLSRYLDALIDLHAKRQALNDDPGSFVKNPSLTAFYRSFAPKALACGWLRMFALEDGDRVIAIQYGFRYRDTYLQMQEGFDPEEVSGLGTALRKSTIDIFIGESISEYDFLGGFTEHKRRWQAKERIGSDLLACNSRIIGRLIVRVGIWPTGKHNRPI